MPNPRKQSQQKRKDDTLAVHQPACVCLRRRPAHRAERPRQGAKGLLYEQRSLILSDMRYSPLFGTDGNVMADFVTSDVDGTSFIQGVIDDITVEYSTSTAPTPTGGGPRRRGLGPADESDGQPVRGGVRVGDAHPHSRLPVRLCPIPDDEDLVYAFPLYRFPSESPTLAVTGSFTPGPTGDYTHG